MVRPDALPVRALGAAVACPPAALAQLFGAGTALRGSERIALTRLGTDIAMVPVEAGGQLTLRLDAHTADLVASSAGLRLRGPKGAIDAPAPIPIAPRLLLPDGLRSAWRMGDDAVLRLGDVAVRVSVADGKDAHLELGRTLWLAAGSPETAAWLPHVELAASNEPEPCETTVDIPRRVVTENDVRQARMRGQTIRLSVGQVVTPAARSMANEHHVFEIAPPD